MKLFVEPALISAHLLPVVHVFLARSDLIVLRCAG